MSRHLPRGWPLWLALLAALALAGCASSGGGVERDGPPRIAGDPWAAAEPEPAVLPRSRYGNPEQYEVFGKRYRVMDSSAGFVQRGNASWYGQKFHGRRTSSGEPFDMFALTAAHRELPIPVIAQVTNLNNGRSIRLRINDRGPFHDNRVLDLSWAAAVRLGVAEAGTAPVEIVVLPQSRTPPPRREPPARVPPPASAPDTAALRPSRYYLQSGAFREATRAQSHAAELEAMGYPVARDAPLREGWFRVWLGPWPDAPAAQAAQAALERRQIPTLLIAQ